MSEINFERKFQPPHRPLSPFLLEEMSVDYIEDRLDPETRVDFEAGLVKEDQLQKKIESLRKTCAYLEHLGALGAQAELVDSILKHRSPYRKFVDRFGWSKWPDFARWAIEAAVVASLAVGFSLFVPWSKFFPGVPDRLQGQTLARMQAQDSKSVEGLGADPLIWTESLRQSLQDFRVGLEQPDFQGVELKGAKPEEGVLIAGVKVPKVETQEAPTESSRKEPILIKEKAKATTLPVAPSNSTVSPPASLPKEKKALALETQTESPAQSIAEAATKPEPSREVQPQKIKIEKNRAKTSGPRGELFRAVLYVKDPEGMSPAIAEYLTSLGAVKAGQVEMGIREKRGNYFHFTIPEERRLEAIAHLETFGRVLISSERHWRVMPENQDRVILWVKQP